MSCGNDPCERCDKRVRSQGDHLCPPCAQLLGRDVGDPWWGDYPTHPDSRLTAIVERDLRFTMELQSKRRAA